MRILYIEDDPTQRTMFGAVLRRNGVDVTAVTQYEGLSVDWRNFDAVLVDVMMPTSDGPSLIREASKQYAPLPTVILFSAMAEELLAKEARDAGDNVQWLSKSTRMDSLLGEIRKRCAS